MANDPSAVTPGDSTYSLRTPDTVSAAAIPQMPMERVLPRQTSTGLARGVQQLGSPLVYVDSGNEQIVVAKTDTSQVTTPQVLMGNQVNKGEGFYVTKPGIDVTSAKNDSDFIFNSNQNVFKIIRKVTSEIPGFPITAVDGGSGILRYAHGLTFTPIVDVYVSAVMLDFTTATQIASSYVRAPIFVTGNADIYWFPIATVGSLVGLTILYGVDSTYVYVQAISVGGATNTVNSIPTTIYLLQETAA